MRPTVIRTITFALCAAPLVAQALLVSRFGVNVLISDEWSLIPFVRLVLEDGNWPAHLFDSFNENRPAVLRLLLAASVPYTRWDAMPVMYVSVLVTTATVAGLWRMFRDATDAPAWYFVPVSWLAVGLAQYQNLFWALQITFLLTTCAAVWCLVAAVRPGAMWFAAAIALAMFGTFSSAGGTLIWPVILIVLIGRRAGLRAIGVWMAAMVVTGAWYAWRLPADPTVVAPGIDQASQSVRFFLTLIGAPVRPGGLAGATLAGLMGVLAAAIVAGLLVRRRDRLTAAHWGPIGLVVFGAAYVALTTWGRARFGGDWALTSRYITITVLPWVGLHMLAVGLAHGRSGRRWPAAAIAIAVLAAAVFADVASWSGAATWARTYGRINKFVLQTRPTIGAVEQRVMVIHPEHAQDVNRERAFLAQERLSYFHDPVEWWLHVDTTDPIRVPVTEQAPVVQRFVCPVETLHDVAIPIDPGRDSPASSLRLDVLDDAAGRVLGSRHLVRSELGRGGRFVVQLRQPLEGCRGRALTFVVTALDRSGDDAFITYHYPAALEGTLLIGDSVPDRSVGLELNARYFDIRNVR